MRLSDIPQINKQDVTLFNKIGLITIDGLLKACSTEIGRKAVALRINIAEQKISDCVAFCDLIRVTENTDHASLLLDVGIRSIGDLSLVNAEKIEQLIFHTKGKLSSHQIPSPREINHWIDKAKLLI